MAATSVKVRLAALEAEVAELKRELLKKDKDSWKRVIGSFANDPMYDEAMELGRKYRKSLKPKPRKKQKKHGDS
jgi:hypothetical protein